MFSSILNNQLDINLPKQKVKKNYKKTPKLPWISGSILRSINRKNNLYYKYKIKGTEQSKRKYTFYKNLLTRIIRLEEKKYFVNRLKMFKHDMQNTWKVIKQAMNLVNKRSEMVEDPQRYSKYL